MRTLSLATLALPFLHAGSSFPLRPATASARGRTRTSLPAGGGGAPSGKRRWRRRRREAAPPAPDAPGPAADSSPRCPLFTASLPRYRIDVRGAPADESDARRRRRARAGLVRPGRGGTPDGGPLGRAGEALGRALGGLGGLAGPSALRGRAEGLQPGAVWWELPPPSAAEGAPRPLADVDIAAQAAFWRAASDFARGLGGTAPGGPGGGPTRTAHLTLSGVADGVAGSLCDILNWHARSCGEGATAAAMGAELVDDGDDLLRGRVAVVRFTGRAAAAADRREDVEPPPPRPSPPTPTAGETELRTKAWVRRVLVGLGVCPFTKSAERSGQGLQGLGVPVAGIMYRHSDAGGAGAGVYELLAGKASSMFPSLRGAGRFAVKNAPNRSPRFSRI